MNIILLAAPGAGKGTQSDLICSKYDFKHISTGDLLRDALVEENELSKQIKKDMEQGKLVSDEIIIKIIKEAVKDDRNYLFDGFPRNLKQAMMLDDILKIDYAINLKVPKEILEKRIVGRITCPKCKAIYNVNFEESKPKKNSICDNCGSELVKRDDDTLATFSNRYETYLNETKPLLDYYKDKEKLIEIDSASKEETFNQISSILEESL